jgi:acyl-coenzyme A synthetase/AMP-(fatty) acid ligase
MLFLIGERPISRSQFDSLIERFTPVFSRHRRILIHSDDPLEQNLALVLSRNLKRELFLCHSYFDSERVQTVSDSYQVDLLLREGWLDNAGGTIGEFDPASETSGGSLYVFTSGTTGEPKIARHEWSTIQHSAAYVDELLSHRKWMMTYSPSTYAGLQVFFSACNSGGSIYYPPSSFEQMARGMSARDVEIVSGSPTFWRLLISSWPSDVPRPKLLQATLGGEVVDQDILDNIKSFCSPRRITHIYASTEAGTAVVVSDGRAGFPVEYLDRDRKVQLRIVDDILQVKTPAPMAEYVGRKASVTDDGWLITGDVVEIRDGRVYIWGREDGMINVGGLKVLPEEVETVLQSFEEVVDCRVFAKPSPILGSLVAAEIVLADGVTFDQKTMKQKLRKMLVEYKVPRLLIPVPIIEATPHGKKNRQ